MQEHLTEAQWKEFERDGLLYLGAQFDPSGLERLRQHIDDIMLGRADLDYDRILMQLDTMTGNHDDVGPQTLGYKGATLNYRKMQNLELDPVFLEYAQRPLFQNICARVYGPDTPVACFRAMFYNKPGRGIGSHLPWHQDRWQGLDRDPQITIWTALDSSTVANGCVFIVPGSHKHLVNPDHISGFLTEGQMRESRLDEQAVPLEVPAGEAVLLHNWLLHSSSVNHSDTTRRAFSVCYMDSRTVSERGHFNVVFGDGALTPETVHMGSPDFF
jgi:hypothetical protein